MIGQTSPGACRSELGHYDFDFVAGILIRPGFDAGQLGLDAGARVLVGVETFHFSTGIKVRATRSRNNPTSVTTPTACPVPRSLTLVATAGLMSTQTIFTHLASMLPTAMECNMEPRQSTRPAPFNSSA